MVSMSGAFDIRSFTDGFYDDTVYFNNPVDFMPNEQGWRYGHMKIVGNFRLGYLSGQQPQNVQNFKCKGIDHWLDIRAGKNTTGRCGTKCSLITCQESFVKSQKQKKTFMKKIGILFGMENTFPNAFIERINSKGEEAGSSPKP
jgi:hypothetical protein